MNDLKGAESEAEQYMTWMEDRFYGRECSRRFGMC